MKDNAAGEAAMPHLAAVYEKTNPPTGPLESGWIGLHAEFPQSTGPIGIVVCAVSAERPIHDVIILRLFLFCNKRHGWDLMA